MKIISLLNNKGGCGKTTTTINLAFGLNKLNQKVSVIDTDPQKSLTEIAKNNNYFPVKSVHIENCVEEFKNILNDKIDYVLVDTYPNTDLRILDLLEITDLSIIPIQPSILDLHASLNTLKAIKKMNSDYCILFNGVKSINEYNKCSDSFNEYKKLSHYIAHRVVYSKVLQEDNINIFDSDDLKAKKEILDISKEVLQLTK